MKTPIQRRMNSAFTLFIQPMHEVAPHRINGNKYADTPDKMIINLYRHALKKMKMWKTKTVIIYDNQKPLGENVVMKWDDGIVVIDNTKYYKIDNIQVYSFSKD